MTDLKSSLFMELMSPMLLGALPTKLLWCISKNCNLDMPRSAWSSTFVKYGAGVAMQGIRKENGCLKKKRRKKKRWMKIEAKNK